MTLYVYMIDPDTNRRWCAGFGPTKEAALEVAARTLANIHDATDIEVGRAILRHERKAGLLEVTP